MSAFAEALRAVELTGPPKGSTKIDAILATLEGEDREEFEKALRDYDPKKRRFRVSQKKLANICHAHGFEVGHGSVSNWRTRNVLDDNGNERTRRAAVR